MRFKIQITVDDPHLEDALWKLGPYKRAVFIREATKKYFATEEGMKLYSRLLSSKKAEKTSTGAIKLDDIL